MPDELCSCGQPLHYTNPASEIAVRILVERLGERIKVSTPSAAYLVPRHYIALHGIKAIELTELAGRYGWERVV